MTDNQKEISIPMAFKLTLKEFMQNQEVISLLALLYTVLITILNWPVATGDFVPLEVLINDPENFPHFEFFLTNFILLVFYGIYISGLARILAKGPQGLRDITRSQALKETLKAIGFMLQGFLFVMIWFIPMIVLGMMSDPNNPNPIFSVLLMTFLGLTFVSLIGIFQSLYVSFAAMGRGEHIPLKRAWLSLEGIKVRFGFYMFVVYFGMFIVTSLFSSIIDMLGLMETMPRFSSALIFGILNFLTSLATFIFLGMADLLAKSNKVDIST